MNIKSWFAVLAIVICCGKPSEATPSPAPEAKCLRERRMHAFGTYRALSYQRADQDLPVDLTITECLEWSR